jgi:hypothetical protein
MISVAPIAVTDPTVIITSRGVPSTSARRQMSVVTSAKTPAARAAVSALDRWSVSRHG